MKNIVKLTIGAFLFVIYAAVGVHTDLLPGNRQSVAPALLAQLDANFQSDEFDWAQLEISGQSAAIVGEAPSEDKLELLFNEIRTAAGAGGPIFGGITNVDIRNVSIYSGPPIKSPFIFTASFDNNIVELSGYAPSQRARDEVFKMATQHFAQASIAGAIEIAGGAPNEDDWLSAISTGIRALSATENGRFELVDNQAVAAGVVSDQSAYQSVKNILKEAPATIDVTADLLVAVTSPPPLRVEPISGGATTFPTVQEVEAANCMPGVVELANSTTITFAPSEVDFSLASRASLRPLADALKGCPAVRAIITGHTDSSGSAARNAELSLFRAAAIAAYLRSLEVNAAQLVTRGAGEAEPLVSNGTLAGRAQNRRIEINAETIETERP